MEKLQVNYNNYNNHKFITYEGGITIEIVCKNIYGALGVLLTIKKEDSPTKSIFFEEYETQQDNVSQYFVFEDKYCINIHLQKIKGKFKIQVLVTREEEKIYFQVFDKFFLKQMKEEFALSDDTVRRQ